MRDMVDMVSNGAVGVAGAKDSTAPHRTPAERYPMPESCIYGTSLLCFITSFHVNLRDE